MRHHISAAVVLTYIGTGLALGQAPSPLEADYTPPHTVDGRPDLQGIWSNAVLTPLERPAEFADQAFFLVRGISPRDRPFAAR